MGWPDSLKYTTMPNIKKLSNLTKIAMLACSVSVALTAQAQCTFNAPQGWAQSSTRWDGACRSGQADGLGVLKEYSGSSVTRFYFGRIKDGQPELGVVDQPDGYVAGRFVNGSLAPSDDRQVVISAFAEAEKAANQAASRFSKAGNKVSAKLYRSKAKALREQMD
jgi:hypothetical protein